jgi:hypothetical protein
MPDWLLVILIAFGALLLLLALGGAVANARRQRRLQGRFDADLDEVNRALAEAHAGDKGWEPAALEATARRFFERERPGQEVRGLTLVQVVDRIGTEEDKAVFRVETPDGTARLRLGRRDGEWVSEGVE